MTRTTFDAALAAALARAANVRELVDDLARVSEDRLFGYRVGVEAAIHPLIELMRQGHSIDVEQTIDNLERDEKQVIRQLEDFKKQVSSAIREQSRVNREALPVLNDLLALATKTFTSEAVMFRDVRWKLMAAEARYQPSDGVGPVHGSNQTAA